MGDEGVATLVPVMINGVWNVGTNYSEIRAFTGQRSLLAWQFLTYFYAVLMTTAFLPCLSKVKSHQDL